jgi:hypothetical protein
MTAVSPATVPSATLVVMAMSAPGVGGAFIGPGHAFATEMNGRRTFAARAPICTSCVCCRLRKASESFTA